MARRALPPTAPFIALVLGPPSLTASAAEPTVEEQVAAIVDAPPPTFSARYPEWLSPEVAVGGGGGWFSMRNPSGDGTALSGPGLNLEALLGDRYFGVISYYVPLRLTLLSASRVAVGDAPITYGEDSTRSGSMINAGFGLKLWVVPKIAFGSADVGLTAFTSNVVDSGIEAPSIEDRAWLPSLTTRAGVRIQSVMLAAAYTRCFAGKSQDGAGQWDGHAVFLNVSFAPEISMQRAGEALAGLRRTDGDDGGAP